jgi:hypothetical protein
MQTNNYYIKMKDDITFKINHVNLPELHSTINNISSKFCYYDDDIKVIVSDKENSERDLKFNQVPSIEVNKEGKVI